jgi:hypothetical protein
MAGAFALPWVLQFLLNDLLEAFRSNFFFPERARSKMKI